MTAEIALLFAVLARLVAWVTRLRNPKLTIALAALAIAVVVLAAFVTFDLFRRSFGMSDTERRMARRTVLLAPSEVERCTLTKDGAAPYAVHAR